MSVGIFIVAGLFIDQVLKFFAGGYLTGAWGAHEFLKANPGYEGYTVPIIDKVFHLTYVENRGAAFGMFQNKLWIFITISSIAFLIIIYILFFLKPKTKIFTYSLALMAVGAGGNLFDRVVRGYVIDYLDVRILNFMVFNFADMCVSVAAALLLWCLLFLKSEPILQGRLIAENEPVPGKGSERVDKFEDFNKDNIPVDEADDNLREKVRRASEKDDNTKV